MKKKNSQENVQFIVDRSDFLHLFSAAQRIVDESRRSVPATFTITKAAKTSKTQRIISIFGNFFIYSFLFSAGSIKCANP